MKKLLFITLLALIPITAKAAFNTPCGTNQGCTQVSAIATSSVIYGGGINNPIATSSDLQFNTSAKKLTVTNASSTNLSAASFCLTGDACRSTWPTGGGSSAILYASQQGCALNSNIDTGGGTDDTRCLQAIIDQIAARPGTYKGTLVIDGVALISNINEVWPATTTALVLKSGVYIDATNGGVFLASSSNEIMIGNQIVSTTTSARHIGIRGGVWNGNQAHQSKWEQDTICCTNGDFHEWVFGMWFGGYEDLLLENITLRNPRTFSITLSNGTTTTITNYIAHWDSVDPTISVNNDDGLHMWGNLNYVTVDNMQSNGDDDTLAFNGCESGAPGDYRRGIPAENYGSTKNVYVNNVLFDNTLAGVRFHPPSCTQPYPIFDNITLRDLHGNIVSFPMADNVDAGEIGRLTIDGWHVTGMNTVIMNANSFSLSDVQPDVTVIDSSTVKLGDYYSPQTSINRNFVFGSNSAVSSASPLNFSLGGSFGNNTAGSTGNLKLDMFNDGAGGRYGYGISNSLLETQVPAGASVAWYVAGNEKLKLSSTGNLGISTTSPWKALSVSGNMVLTGCFFDAYSTCGTAGNILMTTAAGTQWVSSSTAFASLPTVTSYNGTTTAGVGLTPVVFHNASTSETIAGTLGSYQPTATSTLLIGGDVNVLAIATDVGNFRITFTDEYGQSQTINSANISTTGFNSIGPYTIRVKGNTPVTISTVLTTSIGSVLYNSTGWIQKIQ